MSDKGREAFKATCHMFYPSRVVDFKHDGVVKWEGLDNASSLLDDDGNVIEKWEEGMKPEDMKERKQKRLKTGNEAQH